MMNEMSRANIEAYYRSNYRPPLSITPAANQLRMELFGLSKSMRRALQQSWDEADSLKKKCDINTKVIAQHDNEIADMRKKEKAWKGCCLIAEAKLQEKSEETDSIQCHTMLSFPECKQSVDGRNDKEQLQEISEQKCALQNNERLPFPHDARLLVGQNDDQKTLEFVLKISSRDKAISSLEQTLDETIKSIQDLQAEIQSLTVRQQMRDKQIYDSHTHTNKAFKGKIESLRKELSKAVLRNET